MLSWIIKAAPSFLVIALLIFISIKVLNTTIKRLKALFLNQWKKSATIDIGFLYVVTIASLKASPFST